MYHDHWVTAVTARSAGLHPAFQEVSLIIMEMGNFANLIYPVQFIHRAALLQGAWTA